MTTGAAANAGPGDLREAVAILEDVFRQGRRVLGISHPECALFRENVDVAKAKLARAQAPAAAADAG